MARGNLSWSRIEISLIDFCGIVQPQREIFLPLTYLLGTKTRDSVDSCILHVERGELSNVSWVEAKVKEVSRVLPQYPYLVLPREDSSVLDASPGTETNLDTKSCTPQASKDSRPSTYRNSNSTRGNAVSFSSITFCKCSSTSHPDLTEGDSSTKPQLH